MGTVGVGWAQLGDRWDQMSEDQVRGLRQEQRVGQQGTGQGRKSSLGGAGAEGED